MDYAIETLEIEIARIKKALREFRANPNVVTDDGSLISMMHELENQVYELDSAIKVLAEVNKWDREKRRELGLPT